MSKRRGKTIYPSSYTLISVLIGLVFIWIISKITNHFQIHYKTAIFLMILSVVFNLFLYQYHYFLKINELPQKGEFYRVEEIDYKVSFQNNGSADMEHRLLLEANKNIPKDKAHVLTYIFQETDSIINPEVWINGIQLQNSESKVSKTYQIDSENKKYIFTIYSPEKYYENLELRIAYSVENPLSYDSSITAYTYYNTFLADRGNLSYNTNVKGSISFSFSQDVKLNIGSYSKDLFVTTNQDSQNKDEIQFQLKIPFEKYPFSKTSYCERLYDPTNAGNEYIKDISLTTRIDILSSDLLDTDKYSWDFNEEFYSVDKLNELNSESNKNFSDIKFLRGCIFSSRARNRYPLPLLAAPFIYSYYLDKKRNMFRIM